MTSAAAMRSGSVQPQAASGGAKETVEQILVAFILAFVFRCYIVEAFVIPTGSMAPTLLGAHMNFRCPDCGYHFSVNYNAQTATGALVVPDVAAETYPARCPNCGYRFPLVNPQDPANDASQPDVQYGDRILVQKYIYLLHEPRRWDVVVFKDPDQPAAESERFQDNYIKRLIGLPGETLMILDGDIYTTTSVKPFEQLTPQDFTIQTKTPDAQQALWRVVYDDDYRPRGLPRSYKVNINEADPSVPGGTRVVEQERFRDRDWSQPWRPDSPAWNVDGKTFVFDGANGSSALRYDATSMPEKHPLTDWLAYDVSATVDRRTPGAEGWQADPYANPSNTNDVSDVKLAVSYRRVSGDGDLRISTTKQNATFTAVVGKDETRLEMQVGSGQPVVIGKQAMHAGADRPARVELVNADYRCSLTVDGHAIATTTPQQFAPDIAGLLEDFKHGKAQDKPHIRIDAADQHCELAHVGLWRDDYYLNMTGRGFYWAIPYNFPNGDAVMGHLVRLGADEFFVLGDNSMLSGDARIWRQPVRLPYENLDVEAGRVPRRFMLGRAFFVYWPAGFAPVTSLPAFVPNFGEMRFIH